MENALFPMFGSEKENLEAEKRASILGWDYEGKW